MLYAIHDARTHGQSVGRLTHSDAANTIDGQTRSSQMNDNPYESPREPCESPREQGPPSDGLNAVAIALIVVSVLWIFVGLCSIITYVFMVIPNVDAEARPVMILVTCYMGLFILYSLLLVSGALSMVRRGSYVWAVATNCLALVPFLGPFYFLAIPIGIWGLVVLRRPYVRATFRKP